jgi:type VI secretion system protein ImpH
VSEAAGGEPAGEFDLVALVCLLARTSAAGAGDLQHVRFTPETSLAYPASEVAAAGRAADADDGPTVLRTPLIGLLGAMGPMPVPYTELTAARERAGQHALFDLLALIHHPQAALLVRAHLATRFWLQHGLRTSSAAGAADDDGTTQPFTRVLCALVGTLACAAGAPRGLPWQFVVHHAGLLRRRPLPAVSLTALLHDYFGVPVAVRQFTGGYVDLPHAACTRLGNADARVGITALLGDRVFDPGADLLLHIGPVRRALFLELVAAGDAARTLAAAVAFALGPTQAFSYAVELAAEDVPPAVLPPANVIADDAPQRLGWALWLRDGDSARAFVSGPFRVAPLLPASAIQ